MKKLAFLLTLVMLLSLFTGCHSSEPAQQPTETPTQEPTAPTVLGVKEEKVYCNATLDENFEEYSVMVVMTNIASLQFHTYTPEDFPEIACASVEDLSTTSGAWAKAKINGEDLEALFGDPDVIVPSDFYDIDIYKYNQILCLRLKNPGKQNVLDAIKELEKREDVKSASPNYIMSID